MFPHQVLLLKLTFQKLALRFHLTGLSILIIPTQNELLGGKQLREDNSNFVNWRADVVAPCAWALRQEICVHMLHKFTIVAKVQDSNLLFTSLFYNYIMYLQLIHLIFLS